MANIDEKITELFELVMLKKQHLAETKKEVERRWITNGSLPYGGLNQRLNIPVANREDLIAGTTYLLQQQAFQSKAKELLKFDGVDEYAGYSFSDWFSDLSKRATMINLNKEKYDLDELETRLNAIISPEQRRQMELEAITKILDQK